MKTFLKRTTHQQAPAASGGTHQFADNRPEAIAQRRQRQLMDGSAQTAQLQAAQGVVQREGGGSSEWDLENLKGRERRDAVTERPPGMPGRLDVSKMEALLAPGGGGGPSPLDAAAVAAVPEDSIFSKFKRTVFGDKRSTAEKAQAMAAASAQKNVKTRAQANQVGLLGNTAARYLPFIDNQKALRSAAGQKAISHENAAAHDKIQSSLAYKGGGMALSGAASLSSAIPDPLTGSVVKTAAKLGGAALNHVGAKREAESGGLLSEQAASREHSLMTMALASEGGARTQNAAIGMQEARSAAVKAAIPSVPMLSAVGVDEAVGKAVTGVAGKVAGKLLDPSAAAKAARTAQQADSQTTQERLATESIYRPSKTLSPELNTQIKKARQIASATQGGPLASLGIGAQPALKTLKPASARPAAVPREVPPAAALEIQNARSNLRKVPKKEEEPR